MLIEIHAVSTKESLQFESTQTFTNENKALAYLRKLKKMSVNAFETGGYTKKKLIVTIKTNK